MSQKLVPISNIYLFSKWEHDQSNKCKCFLVTLYTIVMPPTYLRAQMSNKAGKSDQTLLYTANLKI
jgi:hypothetical protein